MGLFDFLQEDDEAKILREQRKRKSMYPGGLTGKHDPLSIQATQETKPPTEDASIPFLGTVPKGVLETRPDRARMLEARMAGLRRELKDTGFNMRQPGGGLSITDDDLIDRLRSRVTERPTQGVDPFTGKMETSESPYDRQVKDRYRRILGEMVDVRNEQRSMAETAKPKKPRYTEQDRLRVEERVKQLEASQLKLVEKGADLPVEFKQELEAQRSTLLEIKRETLPQVQEVKPISTMGFPGGLRAVFDGAGIPRKDLVTGAVEIINKNNLMPLVGPGALYKEVDFASGLTRIVKDEFPESFEAFTKEWRGFNAPQEPQKAPAAGEAKPWDPLVQGRQRLREMYQKLGEERELRNWVGIIVFAILAFTVGPRSATAFFNRMKDDGTLGDEIKSLEKEIEEALKIEKEKRDEQMWYRKLAVREQFRRQAREEERDFEWEKMNHKHMLLMQRAEQSGSTDRETIKRMEADWHRAVVERNNAKDVMDRAKATMDDDLKPQTVRDAALETWKIAAEDYKKWSAKMEGINTLLEKYSSGLPAPGQR